MKREEWLEWIAIGSAAAYLVRFFIEETGQFSRPLAFCPKHFTMYQAEERKIEVEVQG